MQIVEECLESHESIYEVTVIILKNSINYKKFLSLIYSIRIKTLRGYASSDKTFYDIYLEYI